VPRSRTRRLARILAVVASCLAVADGFRWGNRWYVSTMFDAPGDAAYAADILAKAHAALVHGLGWLLLAVLAAVVGWRLRVVSTTAPGAVAR